jgi:hypothetical protein
MPTQLLRVALLGSAASALALSGAAVPVRAEVAGPARAASPARAAVPARPGPGRDG